MYTNGSSTPLSIPPICFSRLYLRYCLHLGFHLLSPQPTQQNLQGFPWPPELINQSHVTQSPNSLSKSQVSSTGLNPFIAHSLSSHIRLLIIWSLLTLELHLLPHNHLEPLFQSYRHTWYSQTQDTAIHLYTFAYSIPTPTPWDHLP